MSNRDPNIKMILDNTKFEYRSFRKDCEQYETSVHVLFKAGQLTREEAGRYWTGFDGSKVAAIQSHYFDKGLLQEVATYHLENCYGLPDWPDENAKMAIDRLIELGEQAYVVRLWHRQIEQAVAKFMAEVEQRDCTVSKSENPDYDAALTALKGVLMEEVPETAKTVLKQMDVAANIFAQIGATDALEQLDQDRQTVLSHIHPDGVHAI